MGSSLFPPPPEVSGVSYEQKAKLAEMVSEFPSPLEVNGGSSQVPFTNVDLKSGFRPLSR